MKNCKAAARLKKHLKGDKKDLKDISEDVKHMKKEDAAESRRLRTKK